MDSKEIKEILDDLRKSFKEAIKNNAITEYSLNTGQTQTKVVYNVSQLSKEIELWERKYNEAIKYENNLNILYMRNENVF